MDPKTDEIRLASVLCKTQAGRTEVTGRHLKLSRTTRTLLILIDGRQDLAGLLAALAPGCAHAEEVLAHARHLHAQGLVHVLATGAAKRRSLALAKLHLHENLERALRGRTSTLRPLLADIVDAPTLLRALSVCHAEIAAAAGPDQADAIRQRCLDLLP